MEQLFEQSQRESGVDQPEKKFDYEELRSLIIEAGERDSAAVMRAIVDFDKKLKERYGDAVYQHRLWHLMVGSTPPFEKQMIEADFPGEYSIEQFIRSL